MGELTKEQGVFFSSEPLRFSLEEGKSAQKHKEILAKEEKHKGKAKTNNHNQSHI